MAINETMENYNRRNPFVIVCKDLRDEIDQTAYDIMRMILQCAVMFILIVVISFGTSLVGQFVGENTMVSNFISIILRAITLTTDILFGFSLFLQFHHFTNHIIRAGTMDEVDQILHAEQSEILNSNNEVLLGAIRNMERQMGVMEAAVSSLHRHHKVAIALLVINLLVGGCVIIL